MILGLSDVNLVRVRTTENYMRSCDFIYLVAAIARVQTDKSIGQKMMTKMGYSGYNKTLVCTKIDEVVVLMRHYAFSVDYIYREHEYVLSYRQTYFHPRKMQRSMRRFMKPKHSLKARSKDVKHSLRIPKGKKKDRRSKTCNG